MKKLIKIKKEFILSMSFDEMMTFKTRYKIRNLSRDEEEETRLVRNKHHQSDHIFYILNCNNDQENLFLALKFNVVPIHNYD
jgi:hypothetical protein